jgi:hypothetical protein
LNQQASTATNDAGTGESVDRIRTAGPPDGRGTSATAPVITYAIACCAVAIVIVLAIAAVAMDLRLLP